MTKIVNDQKTMELGRIAIRQIAIKKGLPEATIREEMELAICEAYDLENPWWAHSPFCDRVPTPEEFIVWTVGLIGDEEMVIC